VSNPAPSFVAILVFLAGGLYVGRSVFPSVDEEREINRRLATLERGFAERAGGQFGTTLVGRGAEQWPALEASWKFMEPVVASATKTAAVGTEENLGKWLVEFGNADATGRLPLAPQIGRLWATYDPAGALLWIAQLEDVAEKSAAYQGLAQGWAKTEPLAASEWLVDFPAGPDRSAVVSAFVKSAAKATPQLALGLALEIPEPPLRAELVDVALKQAARVLPQEAAGMIQAAELTAQERTDFIESLESYQLGGGSLAE
jgi:hypothetical protein